MKVAVVGSRGITQFDLKRVIPPDATLIISGGAMGVDSLAERYADEKGIPKMIIRPNYEQHGRSAPILRNKLIVENADLVIAIWDGYSRGTDFTISYAKRCKKPVQVYMV